jgi:hypothetical protein
MRHHGSENILSPQNRAILMDKIIKTDMSSAVKIELVSYKTNAHKVVEE